MDLNAELIELVFAVIEAAKDKKITGEEFEDLAKETQDVLDELKKLRELDDSEKPAWLQKLKKLFRRKSK